MSIADATTSAYRIQHLSGAENYSTWKIKMSDILTDMGLYDYVFSIIPKPEDAKSDSAKAWQKKDRQALSAIRLRVGDEPLVYIADAETSAAAWKTLSDMYQPKGAIGIILARRKLFRAECLEGEDIEEHIRTMTRYRQQLTALNSKITDDEFSITLLTSLPESWNSFIQGIDTSSLGDSSRVIARILEQARRQDAKPSSDDVALAARAKAKGKAKGKCFRCGNTGHFIRDCPEPSESSSSESEDESPRRHSKREKTTAAVAVYDSDYTF